MCEPATASTRACSAPAPANKAPTASGSVRESHGLYARVRSGRTSSTAFQNSELAGSNTPGPQVVTASWPPGATSRHSAAVPADMSGRKNTPNTMMTASNEPGA